MNGEDYPNWLVNAAIPARSPPFFRSTVQEKKEIKPGKSNKGPLLEFVLGKVLILHNGKQFLLEMDNGRERDRILTAIRRLGGSIVHTVVDGSIPHVVISDHVLAEQMERRAIDVATATPQVLRAIPALLREALKRNIKIRRGETFMRQLSAHKTRIHKSASTSTSYHRQLTEKVTIPGKQRLTQGSGRIGALTNDSDTGFIRIDVPRKRPDVKVLPMTCFRRFHCGQDCGYGILKRADPTLIAKRKKDYELFLSGNYIAPKKKMLKIEEDEELCDYCKVVITDIVEHERSEAHKKKLYSMGILQQLERVVMSTRLEIEYSARAQRKSFGASPSNSEEYEYGENPLRVYTEELIKANPAKVRQLRQASASPAADEKFDGVIEINTSAPSLFCPMSLNFEDVERDFNDFVGVAPPPVFSLPK